MNEKTVEEYRAELADLQDLHDWDLRFLESQGLLGKWEEAEAEAHRETVYWLESHGCSPIFPGVIAFINPLEFLAQQEKGPGQ